MFDSETFCVDLGARSSRRRSPKILPALLLVFEVDIFDAVATIIFYISVRVPLSGNIWRFLFPPVFPLQMASLCGCSQCSQCSRMKIHFRKFFFALSYRSKKNEDTHIHFPIYIFLVGTVGTVGTGAFSSSVCLILLFPVERKQAGTFGNKSGNSDKKSRKSIRLKDFWVVSSIFTPSARHHLMLCRRDFR